jgi:hypothetical protein
MKGTPSLRKYKYSVNLRISSVKKNTTVIFTGKSTLRKVLANVERIVFSDIIKIEAYKPIN